MRLRLMAHTEAGYQEFRLPAINNADYEIVLPGSKFSWSRNLKLSMEIQQGEWAILGGKDYRIVTGDVVQKRLVLKDEMVFMVTLLELNANVAFVVSEKDEVLESYQKYNLRGVDQVTIGRDESNVIRYDFKGLASKQHAVLQKSGKGYSLTDTSRNGIYVNGRRLQGSRKLSFGDTIGILGLNIVYLGNVLAVDALSGAKVNPAILELHTVSSLESPASLAKGKVLKRQTYFKRVPRVVKKLHSEPVEIEEPPAPDQEKKQPLIMAIAPAFTMMIPMMLASVIFSGANSRYGVVMAGSSAVLGVMWALINVHRSKKQRAEVELNRLNRYRDYLTKITNQLEVQYADNTKELLDRYPSASECLVYDEHNTRLWNRNETHSDFLFVRLGIGALPFQVSIQVPKGRFTLFDDSLTEKPRVIQESLATLKDVPVGVDLLKTRLLGIYGDGNLMNSIAVGRSMAIQLAANNCYTDVKMVFLYEKEYEHELAFVQWFPHVWSEDMKVRFVASGQQETSDTLYSVATTLRIRAEQNETNYGKQVRCRPHYVVFVCNPELLEGEPAAKFLLDPDESLSVSTVLIASSYEALPNCCTDLVQNDSDFQGMYNVSTVDAEKSRVAFDIVRTDEALAFSRRLAAIRVNELESGGEIANSLTFLDMHQVKSIHQFDVLTRWRKNRTYESLKALVGQKAGGMSVYLDIHEKYHGPHGLVAGTTGSGKSETLQTYILSLAINFSPLDVGFFIIDYKGGGMANLFSDLPHMLGQISNLSGNQVRRAMVSIKSEIKRRQRIFGEHDVNHLNKYTHLLKNGEASISIPHLLIIIDEFAELKREEPDFMRELISVAQVGRSLGIHLILATQKPGGTVDDSIWSNSKFRLCLRVQDKQDSQDMLKRPDAAYITQAGRCYMQVGNDEIFELFQSGWSGAAYDEEASKIKAELATMLTATAQPSLVGNRNKIKMKERKRDKWLSLLIQCICSAANNAGMELIKAAKDEQLLTRIVSETFSLIAAGGSEYPQNQFNEKRIIDLICLMNDDASRLYDVGWINARAMAKGVALPEVKEKTQLAAVVEHLAHVAAANEMITGITLWLPVLPHELYLMEIPGFSDRGFTKKGWRKLSGQWSLEAIIGLYDDPANQTQAPLKIDLAEGGHLAVCGSVVSGKSTFVQTALYSLVCANSPDAMNMYVLDYGSRMLASFEGLPHCGGVVFEGQAEQTDKLFVILKKELARRKELFRGGNYSQYIRAHGQVQPTVLLVIDGYANFRDKTGDRYEDDLLVLSREGANFGIFLFIAAGGFGGAEIQNRIAENFKSVFCLQLGDRLKYWDMLGMRTEIEPEADVAGRGLALVHGVPLEFQTALSLPAEDDYKRAEQMQEEFARMREFWTGRLANPIPVVPTKPIWKDFAQLPGYQAAVASDRLLPIGYNMEDAGIYSIDLSTVFTYLVAGKTRCGKTNLLRCILHAAKDRGGKLIVVDSSSGALENTATALGAEYVATDKQMRALAESLLASMGERNVVKKELRTKGADDEATYLSMKQFDPIYIFIDNLGEFITRLYGQADEMASIVGFLENFFEKGALHNIFVFASLPLEEYGQMLGRQVFAYMLSRRTGILLGGNAAEQRVFDMSGMSYQEQAKPLKAGIGIAAPSEQHDWPCKVAIPFMRG